MLRLSMLLTCAAMLASCQPADPPAQAADEHAESVPAKIAGRKVAEETGLVLIEYSYPAEAAAIPALAAVLDADLEKQRTDLVDQAQDGAQLAKESGYPFNPYGFWEEWQVAADLPRWLSLSANVSVYSGGAHPNHWFDALLWDREEGIRREALDLFSSKEAFNAATREAFCEEIDRQREEKRGEKVERSSDNPFDECLDPADYRVVPGSSTGKAFDRVGILVPPYEAGPYAEGSYEVTLPVTPALLDAVKPEYRAYFALKP